MHQPHGRLGLHPALRGRQLLHRLDHDLGQRLAQHHAGTFEGYTSTRLPVECVYVAEFQSMYEAIAWERTVKRWSRAKKEAVIAGAWDSLPALARSYQHHGRPGEPPASFDTPRREAGAAQDD